MSDSSDKLNLPYIQPSQAQKHVTHNEAIRILDVLTQMSVQSDDNTAPPGGAVDGDSHIVPLGGQFDWAGQDGKIATLQDGSWQFLTPAAGWRAYVAARGAMVVYDGAAWGALGVAEVQNADLIGLNTTADGANPFSAKVNSALWTALPVADGGSGDIRMTMNKDTTGYDVGMVFQTGYVTKALLGCFGSDALRLSVSQDGSAFFDGISFDPATGIASQPQLPRAIAYTNYDNWLDSVGWTTVGLNNADYNAQGVFDGATNAFTAPVAGTYQIGATLAYQQDSTAAGIRGRLVLNGTTQLRGGRAELPVGITSGEAVLHLQTLVSLSAGDVVTLQGQGVGAPAYAAADQTTMWIAKIG